MINEQSLLHCTVRKATSLTKKLIIIGIILLGSYWMWLTFNSPTASAIHAYIYVWIISSTNVIFGVLVSVPWQVYIFVGIPLGILIYSYLWCVARTLNESDWESDEAHISFIAAFFSFLFVSFFLNVATLTSTNGISDSPFALVIIFMLNFIGIAISFVVIFEQINCLYYMLIFPGAWIHHRKNNKIGVYHD